MLAWMFNRNKSKEEALDDRASTRLRELADVVKTVAPDEFSQSARRAVSTPDEHSAPLARSGRIPRHPDEAELAAPDESNIGYALDLHDDEADEDDVDARPIEDDSDARMDAARRLRRHLPELSPSERVEMVDEFINAVERMSDCYRPQVIALIDQELGHTPYMTRQSAARLRHDLVAIGQVNITDYVELLSDADFLDLLRGRGEFVMTAQAREIAERERAENREAEQARQREKQEKSGLLSRLLAADEPRRDANVVAFEPKSAPAAAQNSEHENPVISGRNRISRQAQRRVAHFIAASLFDTMVEQGRLRSEVARALRQAVRQRIEKARFENRVHARAADPAPDEIANADLTADGAGDVAQSFEAMTVDQIILDALSRNEDGMVVQGLAHYGQLPPAIVSKILDSGSARAITALAWRAGMTAPSAVVLQINAGISQDNIERPAAGNRYAMASTDMDWYIDFFNELQPAGPRKRSAAAVTASGGDPRKGEKASGATRRKSDAQPAKGSPQRDA